MNAPRFCPTCGQGLPGPVPRCPRCGADIGAALGYQKKTSGTSMVLIVIAAILGGTACIGMLAAIAIPNFVRYQLRAKQSEVPINLSALVRAERARAGAVGKYLPVPGIPAGDPGSRKVALTADDLRIAGEVDWRVEGALYGRYRVAVVEDNGVQAASLCGEQDLDGDGQQARFVAFLPGDGVAPPPAPCSEPVPWSTEYALGEVTKVTEDGVF